MTNNTENEKEFNFKNIIKELPNFFPILTLLTLFSGIAVIYYHLRIIDKVGIFPEMIGQTQAYIAIIFGSAFFFLISFFYFVFLLMLISGLHSKFKEVETRGKFILFGDFIIIATFPFILECCIQKFSLENHAKYYFIAVVFIVYLVLNIFLHSINKENLFRLGENLIISLFLTIFSMWHFIVQTEMVGTNLNSIYFSLYIVIFIIFQVFGIEFLGKIKLLENKNNQMLLVCVFSFIFVFYGAFHSNSLTFFHFIEKPQDSSWYLIHNGNTTSENINGFSKNDILSQKEIFNAKDCTTLKNLENQDKCKDDNQEVFNNRDNALYGYMAWNLGSTKFFCPVSVDFFKFTADEENQINHSKDIAKTKFKIQQEKSAKCLVIDGKYLQLVSKHYLAK